MPRGPRSSSSTRTPPPRSPYVRSSHRLRSPRSVRSSPVSRFRNAFQARAHPPPAGAAPRPARTGPSLRSVPCRRSRSWNCSEAPLLDILRKLTNHDAENDSAFLPELRAVYIDCFRAAVSYCALLAALEGRYSDDAGEGTVQLDSFVMTAMAPSVPHLLAIRLLETHGMDISISHVFGGNVV
ncbi:hypothetical protein C8F04DRAFT_1261315 [Mycena alexandri]|uniref:Uncharacterized protein n=1 Tax=Mycena alexandri TaxID=1745969 RepID=A0AAD6X308_9AGAR|nr:hypothetical protein C8F04DRAFT_1261315 [Mycena alexandri]